MPRPFPSILNRSQTKRPGEESRDCFVYSLSPTRRLHCKLKKQLVTVSSLILTVWYPMIVILCVDVYSGLVREL